MTQDEALHEIQRIALENHVSVIAAKELDVYGTVNVDGWAHIVRTSFHAAMPDQQEKTS